MSEELQDEVTSINSIYGDDTFISVSETSPIYALSLPVQSAISLRIEFPSDYPDAPPSILGTQHVGDEIPKGEGTTIVELVRTVLAEIYSPGSPCIFDLIEESGQRLQQLGLDQSSKDQEQQAAQANGQHRTHHPVDDSSEAYADDRQPLDEIGDPPPWTLSDPVTEQRSTFVARVAPVGSPAQAAAYVQHLLASDRRVRAATHNITAWRIRGARAGTAFQDCDDDGETAAGGRLLHLMQLMELWDCMVVVTRWYGGLKLGPRRFALINQVARDAFVRAGLVAEG